MKFTKKMLPLLLAVVMILTTGCGSVSCISIDKKGNVKTTESHIYYTKSEMLSLESISDYADSAAKNVLAKGFLADYDTKVISGKTYYTMKNPDESESVSVGDTMRENGGYLSSDSCELPFATYEYSEDAIKDFKTTLKVTDFLKFKITYPYKVLASNGTISEDGYTVTYSVANKAKKYYSTGFRLYAAFTKSAVNGKKITIKGAANGKTYSSNRTITVSTKGTVVAFKVNGKSAFGRSTVLTDSGNYKVYVKLLSGATKTIKFSIKKNYKLTYKVNGGKALKKSYKTVKYGNKYGKLATPTRKGYKFLGWYTKKSGGKKITAKTVCKGKKTVYAHWKKK